MPALVSVFFRSTRRAAALAIASLSCAWAGAAYGQEAPATANTVATEPPPSGGRAPGGGAPSNASTTRAPGGYHFYGWQSMLAGGLGAAVLGGGIALAEDNDEIAAPTLVVGSLLYVSLPPTIHGFHDKPAKAAGSIGIAVGVPLTGVFLGYVLGPRCEGDCFDAPLAGLVTGLFVAPLIDGLLLGWEREGEAHEAPRTSGPGVVVFPGASRDGVSLHVGGRF